MSLVNVRTLVGKYGHIYTIVGITGNVLFVVGSILFFKEFDRFYTFGVWMFVLGSFCMLIGTLGTALGRLYERGEEKSATNSD
jgi:hypothetical protein